MVNFCKNADFSVKESRVQEVFEVLDYTSMSVIALAYRYYRGMKALRQLVWSHEEFVIGPIIRFCCMVLSAIPH